MMISDLPGDLEWDILSRVPTKSLANLQITCKRWYALFKKNKGKSAREVILLMNSRVHSISVNLHGIYNGIDPYLEFRGTLINTLNDFKDVEISEIYHCDGLMLCVTKEITHTSVVVWNPCTGVTRCIKPRSCYKRCYFYALGYGNSHSSSPSYKVLRCSYYGDFSRRIAEVALYEFSSDSWKVLHIDAPHGWNSESQGVSLKGNTYWIGFDRETSCFYLLSFDFTTERFGRLPLPDNKAKGSVVLSVVKDERLAVLYQDFSIFPRVMKIWMSNKIVDTKDMSWSNFLVVNLNNFKFPKVTSFLLDEENKVAVCCHRDTESRNDIDWESDRERTVVYIVGEDIYKEAYNETTKESVFNWPLLVSYVPSLVQIHAKGNETKGGRDGNPSS